MLCQCLTVVLLQALLHQFFIHLLTHIAVVLECEEVYSLEVTTTSVRHKLSISFWEGRDLITLTISHCGRNVPFVKSSVLLCSQVLSAVSLNPTIIQLYVVRVEVLVLLRHWTRPPVRKLDYNIHSIYYRCRLRR